VEKELEQNAIRVLIVDDHPIVRAGLVSLLGKEPGLRVAGSVNGGEAALTFLQRHAVDVVLLDLRMPKLGGLDLIPYLRQLPVVPQVLILSSFDYEEEIYRAAKAGARGYLLKDSNRTQIVEALRRVASGHLHFPKSFAEKIADRESRIGLSPREQDVLIMISKGLTNKEIGRALLISQFTVRNHVNHILEKLDAGDRTEAVSIAMQQGVILLSS
jgi:DNA-binding NarL/FixJ family response regulator